MEKRSRKPVVYIVPLLIAVSINAISYFLHTGFDLTNEKRFTLSPSTEKLISSINMPLELTVFLEGDMPAGFRRLANTAEDLGAVFNALSGGKFSLRFEKPGSEMPDSSKAYLFDSLQRMGINPTNVKAQVRQGEQTEETLVFPGAILSGGGRQVGIDFLEGQDNMSGLTSLNNAEALMEFKLAKAAMTLTRDTLPLIAYLAGNGQPLDLRIYDLIENVLKKDYRFTILAIDSIDFIPEKIDAVIIVKPIKEFNQDQKLKMDQYIMRGGKVLWALDNLYASMDSLQKSSGSFVAFDLGLGLDDQLFKYGVRINRDLVQDLQSDKIPSVIGNIGDRPQIELLPWSYSPLIQGRSSHPISKDLNFVLTDFPQSLDTVSASGIQKTILLSSSDYARSLQTPAIVEWRSIRNEEDLKNFNRKNISLAVLLEGKFGSAFRNRLSADIMEKMAKQYGRPFITDGAETQMIVLSDGDIPLNPVSERDGPLAMGENSYTRERFANRDFINNSLFYLTGGASIMDARAKTFTLRLLDKAKVQSDKSYWQLLNLLLPIAFSLLLLPMYHFFRKRKFGQTL